MKAKDIMTPAPSCCSPADSIRDVARTMRDNDCGSVPVVDAGRVIGIVTDRDLTVRALANGMGSDSRVEEFITTNPCCCGVDDDVRQIEKAMADNQVRRIPIVDALGRCVGIVSQADLAHSGRHGGRVSDHEVAIVVERISEPQRLSVMRGATGEFEQVF